MRRASPLPRPNVGFYCPGNGTGGPWRYVHSILAGLDPTEFDVSVFCDLPGEYEPRPWVKVVPVSQPIQTPAAITAAPSPPSARQKSLRKFVPRVARLWAGFGKQARQLARLIRRHPVDIFHTQNTGCEESPVAAKLAGVRRVIGTFHVDSTYDLHRERSSPADRLLEVVSNRCLDTAIAVSHATKRDWVRRSRIPANRVVTIHNGIDVERFQRRESRADARRELGLPDQGFVIGGLGRLDDAKGFTYLIDAVASLRPEFSRLTLAIAGSGPLQESLKVQATCRGLGDVVRFLGFQSDVQRVLDSVDVFAMPSRCETLGYALLEAMATELPAVGSSVGGIPEVIVEGVTGFVVPPRNVGRLAEGLRVLLRDADLRRRMGVAARERVARHFREDDMVRKTIKVYREN